MDSLTHKGVKSVYQLIDADGKVLWSSMAGTGHSLFPSSRDRDGEWRGFFKVVPTLYHL